MSFFWIQHQLGLLISLLVIMIIALSNSRILQKLGDHPMPTHFPIVSVLVPARNEEDNIYLCASSLLNQDYSEFEVLVLDDNSTDGTWQILSELASGNSRIRTIKGKPLPDGWLGKHWACHQLAQEAEGELLLFTDADTRHHPLTLRDAVASLFAWKADLLTAFPYEEVVSWGERLTVPLVPWFAISFLPLFLAYRLPNPSLSATIGQFMLFRREAYEKIGGYEAIRQEPVDDVVLGRKIKAEGLKWRMINGSERVRCRMYHSFREAYSGFTKNLFAGFNFKILKFILIWMWLGIAFIEPIIVLAIALAGLVSLSAFSIFLATAAIAISLVIWGISNWRFHFPMYLTLLYPLTIAIALSIAIGSIISALTGKINWKGRTFSRPNIRWW